MVGAISGVIAHASTVPAELGAASAVLKLGKVWSSEKEYGNWKNE